MSGGKAALVLATSHDAPTQFVRRFADEIVAVLKASGFDVVECLDANANYRSAYVAPLMHRKTKGLPFKVGYLSAHGSDEGLHDGGGGLLFEVQACSAFRRATVVMVSCLATGAFPIRATTIKRDGGPCIQYVIGYKNRCAVPSPKLWGRRSKAAKNLYGDTIRLHIQWVLSGLSVPEIATKIQQKWEANVADAGVDELLAHVMAVNAQRIRYWINGKERCP